MPDLTDLLDRTTPRDLPPLDVDHVAGIARHRRQRRRVASVSLLSLAVVGVVAAVVALRPTAPSADLDIVTPGPDGGVLQEPAGVWREGAAPPFSERSGAFAATLEDERVLVWGGSTVDGGGREGGGTLLDGGIYDAAADQWEAIEPAPLPPGTSIHVVQYAGGRLLVLDPITMHGAVYDVAEGRWELLPEQSEIQIAVDGVAWNGDVLAVVRTSEGAVGHSIDPGLDWRVEEPVTLRWRVGGEGWTQGARPPLGFRFGSAVAFDGERLALVGGTRRNVHADGPPPAGRDAGLAGDGAIYDLTADRWTPIPAPPTGPAIHATATWEGGRLLVAGGDDRLSDPGPDRRSVAAFDPATSTWELLEAAPASGLAEHPSSRFAHIEGGARFLVADGWNQSGPHPTSFFGPGGWEQAPLADLHQLGDLTIATSATIDNPGDGPFDAFVRVARDRWVRAAEAPFTNRMEPAVASTGSLLVVVGGAEGANILDRSDTWVLDLAAAS